MDILTTYNPSTERNWQTIRSCSRKNWTGACRSWRSIPVLVGAGSCTTIICRGNLSELDRDLDDLARLMSEEMGKIQAGKRKQN